MPHASHAPHLPPHLPLARHALSCVCPTRAVLPLLPLAVSSVRRSRSRALHAKSRMAAGRGRGGDLWPEACAGVRGRARTWRRCPPPRGEPRGPDTPPSTARRRARLGEGHPQARRLSVPRVVGGGEAGVFHLALERPWEGDGLEGEAVVKRFIAHRLHGCW